MARIGEGAFRQYVDGQDRLTAREYMSERELIRLAVNDLDDKVERTEGIREEFTNTVNEVENVKGEVVQTKQEIETRIGEFTQTVEQTTQEAQQAKEEAQQAKEEVQVVSVKLEDTKENIQDRGVFVEDFNAKGDGVSDDSQAFIDAFKYAKGKKIKVVAKKKTYKISSSVPIDIYNDVDFGGAEFIVDDTKGPAQHLFRVLHDTDSYTLNSTTLALVKNKFTKGTTRIPELAGLGNVILHIYDSTKRMYIREGGNADSGSAKFDQITIDNEGYLTSQLAWSFDNITSIIVQKMDDKVIEIKNGTFISSNNVPVSTITYMNKGMSINRSNIIISNITHRVASESAGLASRNGFIFMQNCANVILDRINLQPLKQQSQGTYEIGGFKVMNIKMYNINGQSFDTSDRWGVMGTNFFKDVLIRDSNMSRIDSHSGLYNLTIENCVLGFHGVTVVGHGDLNIRNCKVFSHNIVSLREDYGAFWDGNIFIDNVYHKPPNNSTAAAIRGNLITDWDFGYPTSFGTGIISIENYTYDAEFADGAPVLFRIGTLSKYDGTEKSKYKVARTLKASNVLLVNKQGNFGFKAIATDVSKIYAHDNTVLYPDGNFFPNVSVLLDNVEFYSNGNTNENISSLFTTLSSKGFDGSDDYGTVLNRVFFRISLTNIKRLYANVKGMYTYLYIDKSIVHSIRCNSNGSRSFVFVSNSTIRPIIESYTDKAVHGKKEALYFSNCYFTRSYYINNAPVSINNITNQYEFLKIGSVGTTASIEANLSSCVIDPEITFSQNRADIALTGLRFGNNHYAQKFPLKKGTTAQRPPSADVEAVFQYYDTTLNKPITWDGTAWKDATGTSV